MSKKYKLLTQNWTSHSNCKWTAGEWKEATGSPMQPLCTNAWLHYYDHPLLAVLHNPMHSRIGNPIMVEVEIDGESKSDGLLESGCRRMRVLRQIPLPKVTIKQRVRYAILCAKQGYSSPGWNKWADNWLNGIDRSYAAADAAADIDAYAADNASFASAFASAFAARLASCAAAHADRCAEHATDWDVEHAIGHSADAAGWAAHVARINLIELAQQATEEDDE